MARILLFCAAKKFQMKKVFVVIAVAAAMAACNNSAGADGSASPTGVADSATKMASDSVKAPASDSSSMKMDSAARDTTKKM
jgi:predicted small secreted protein